MMEAVPRNIWQPAYVNSPTGSDDSGVELSPTRTITYGALDECYSQMYNDGRCPESPAFSSGSSQAGEGNIGCPVSLTQEELDTLSDTLSDAFSPSPGDQQASVADLTEIGHFDLQHERLAENLSELLKNTSSQERCVNTLKRKRRQKARQIGLRENNPGVDPCLVPKSGTAKPRQSRKKRKSGQTESMAGGQGLVVMNQKKYYAGARVKETARERLQRLREEKLDKFYAGARVKETAREGLQRLRVEKLDCHGNPESGTQMNSQGVVRNVNYQPPAKRQATAMNEAGTSYDISYPVSQAQGTIPHTARAYTHSIGNILFQPQVTVYHGDTLDSILEEAIERGNTNPLGGYAQQTNIRFSGSGQTAFLHILKRLVESKDRFPAHKIKNITVFLCKILPDWINAQNYQGETPIYQAALYGNEGAVQALMEEGADPWKQENSAGETALHAAVKSKKLSVVDAILRGVKSRYPYYAAGINIPSCDGNTPLHKAAALRDVDSDIQREIVTALLASDADPSIKNNQNQMAHSFLPESLKELQVRMKRHNGRRNRSMAQHSAVAQDDSPPYCHALQSQYARHFTPEMIRDNHIAQRNQLGYGNLPQTLQAFPATTQQPPFPQFEPQYALPYYGDPRTTVTTVIPPLTNPEEFDDLNLDLPF